MTQRKRSFGSFAFHSYEALWGVYRIHEAWLMIIKPHIKEFNTPLCDEALCTRGFRLIDSTWFLPELDSLVGGTGSWKNGSLGWFVSPAGGTLRAIPLKRLFQNISPSTACLVSPATSKTLPHSRGLRGLGCAASLCRWHLSRYFLYSTFLFKNTFWPSKGQIFHQNHCCGGRSKFQLEWSQMILFNHKKRILYISAILLYRIWLKILILFNMMILVS